MLELAGWLENKIDYLRLDLTTQRKVRDCNAIILTEMWLNNTVLDYTIQVDGLTTFRADRSHALSGKSWVDVVCIFINDNWCTNAKIVSSHCSEDIEFPTLICQPSYMPREFTAINITAVYIPPIANTKEALSTLYQSVSSMQNSNADSVYVIAGDFNQANLKTVLPHYYKHANFMLTWSRVLSSLVSNRHSELFPTPTWGTRTFCLLC